MDHLLFGVGPWAVPTAAVCAFVGSFILTPLTKFPGVLTFALNAILLFAGAMAGNILGKGLDFPITKIFEKPVILSLAGMTVTGILLVAVFLRNSRS